MRSLILENSPCLIPLTFMTSSLVLNGRLSMIAWAFTGPIPGRLSSSSLLAVLRFTGFAGVGDVAALVAGRAVVERPGRAAVGAAEADFVAPDAVTRGRSVATRCLPIPLTFPSRSSTEL